MKIIMSGGAPDTNMSIKGDSHGKNTKINTDEETAEV